MKRPPEAAGPRGEDDERGQKPNAYRSRQFPRTFPHPGTLEILDALSDSNILLDVSSKAGEGPPSTRSIGDKRRALLVGASWKGDPRVNDLAEKGSITLVDGKTNVRHPASARKHARLSSLCNSPSSLLVGCNRAPRATESKSTPDHPDRPRPRPQPPPFWSLRSSLPRQPTRPPKKRKKKCEI